MENAKRKRGRPPKQKAMEFEGMTNEGAINQALDQEVKTELDDTLSHKDESQLTEGERKYLKRKREKKSYTLNVRFTESEMQDILSKCEQYGYKNKTEYIRDCVRARVISKAIISMLSLFIMIKTTCIATSFSIIQICITG